MTAELQRSGIFGVMAVFHLARPQPAGGPELGDLLKQVVVDVEKERELRGEAVHGKSSFYGSLDVGQPIIEGKGQFLHRGRSGLANVIAADADWMPFGNLFRAVGDGVGNEAQRGFWREEPFFLGDVFLQDVVL